MVWLDKAKRIHEHRSMRWRAVAGLLVGASLLGGAWYATRRSGAAPPSVLLVTIDTLRADHTEIHGYARPTAPHLDALAREGTVFLAAYTPTPTTGPSHSTLFTSSYPSTHGVRKNGYALLPERRTLAEVLRDAGWHTGAVVSAFPLAARFGYARGFEHYDDQFPLETASIDSREWEGFELPEAFDRRADATTDRALAWLDATPADRPWFLWVHYYDPHAPYDPPQGFRRLVRDPGGPPTRPLEQAIVAYDAEIRFADEQIGRLLHAAEARAGAEHLLVVAAADHGEGLMSHGWMEHGVNLYEELVHTLLLVRWPARVRAGQRVDGPVGLIDMAPTVLSLLGVPAASIQPEGMDLSRVLVDGAPPPSDRPLYFQRRLYTERDEREWPAVGDMFGVRWGAWKYVTAPEEGKTELFDLARDPGEARNLAGSSAGVEARLAAAADSWAARQRAEAAGLAHAVSAEDAARLRALGYVE
jgi:arylsulfatase A-like enzyme